MVTTWGYNLKKGVNNSVSYSDSTPGIQYAYNYLNQLTQVTDASGSRVLTYTPCNEPDTDSITIGGSSYQLQEHYDTYGRSSGYTLKQGTDVLQEASQGYEADGRLASAGIRHGGTEQSFAYGYLAGSSLLSSLAMPDGIVRELAYEQRRNLITGIDCRLGETVLVSRSQGYDALGRPVTAPSSVERNPPAATASATTAETNSPLPPWAPPPTATATTTSATARRHGNRPENSPTRPTGSTSTPALKKAGKRLLCRRTTPRATRPSSRRQRACGPWSTTRPTAR